MKVQEMSDSTTNGSQTAWLHSFDPDGMFVSPDEALVQIHQQTEPLEALLAVVRANVAKDECGFAAEVVRDFNDFTDFRGPTAHAN